KEVPHKSTLHGETRVDNYHWLRDKKDARVIAHLEAENAYTGAVMKPTEALQQTLYKEFLGRIKQTDMSMHTRHDGYWYYSRTIEGKQYPVHCRKKGSLDAAEYKQNTAYEMAKGHKFYSVGARQVSDDGHLLAFTTDLTGFREYHLSVKDL